MARQHNSDVNGNPFVSESVKKVWEKGRIIPTFSKDLWRWDICGNVIFWPEYGNRQSSFGWEIDHIIPVEKGGTDDLINLQPLQWNCNVEKGNTHPWSCR